LLAEQLAGPESNLVEAHVQDCNRCQDTLAELCGEPLPDKDHGLPITDYHPSPEFLVRLQQGVLQVDVFSGADGGGRVGGEGSGVSVEPVLSSAAPLPVSPDSSVARPGVPPELVGHPRYKILEILGAGGMGSVFKAEHRLMERPVALKLINPKLIDKAAMVERFRREVKAAARLSHANIVEAYDADQAGDNHFLVMEFVEGESLSQILKREGRLPVAQACDFVRQAALGLQHAHACGMVHRDIKPANLMLAKTGEVKILDFGLARFASTAGVEELDADASTVSASGSVASIPGLTRTGMVMGTPDYMAPEQALNPSRAGITADIYSLGCTLYHFLAGQPPFAGGTAAEKMAAHWEKAPRPLSELRPEVSPALAHVVERMMAKDPACRFQTPGEVAEALAFHSQSFRKRRWRWLAAAAALALVPVLALIARLRFREDVASLPPPDPVAATTAPKVAASASNATLSVTSILRHGGTVTSIVFDAAGRRLASGGFDQTVRIWDWQTRKPLLALENLGRQVSSVAFSPDGKKLAAATGDYSQRNLPGSVRIWDLDSAKVTTELLAECGIFCVAFDAHGQRLAYGGFDSRVRIVSVATGKELMKLDGHGLEVWGVAFSPDGKRLASASHDRTIKIWRLDSGQAVVTVQGEQKQIWGVAFSPDGSKLASAGDDGTIKLWDAQTGNLIQILFGHTISPYSVAFSADGRWIVSASGHRWLPRHSGEVVVWDATTGDKHFSLPNTSSGFFGAALSPDGNWLAAASMDGSVRIAHVDAPQKSKSGEGALTSHRMRAAQADRLHTAALRLGPDEALPSFSKALALREQLVRESPENAGYAADRRETLLAMGHLHWKARRLAEAAACWRKGLDDSNAALRRAPRAAEALAEREAQIAEAFANLGLWHEAASFLAGAFSHGLSRHDPADNHRWRARALTLLLTGDRRGYERLCDAAMDRFGPKSGWADPVTVAYTWSLSPRAIRGTEWAKLIARTSGRNYPQTLTALARYRAGQWKEAIADLDAAEDNEAAKAWILLAMSHHGLGHAKEAQRWLEKAERRYQQTSQDIANEKPPSLWWDWALFQILRREAKAMIEGRPAADDPYLDLHFGRCYALLESTDKAETHFQAAVGSPGGDGAIWLARGRVFAQLGRHERAQADFDRATSLNANDPRPWIERGRRCAEWGLEEEADAAFAEAARRAPNELDRFLQSGWWVVGPFPRDLNVACPPEKQPVPSRPVPAIGKTGKLAAGAAATVPWRRAPAGAFGHVNFRAVFDDEFISAYALNYLWSPHERTATLLVGGDDAVKVWLNGQVVLESTRLYPEHSSPWSLLRVPVTLRAGRNTILARVGNDQGAHFLHMVLADEPMAGGEELLRAGLWKEAASWFARFTENSDDPVHHFLRAYGCVRSGDRVGYQQVCRRMLERLASGSKSPRTSGLAVGSNNYTGPAHARAHRLNWTARACMMAPDTVTALLEPVHVAEHALAVHPAHSGLLLAVAGSHYRAGQFDEAIRRAEESLAAAERPDGDDRGVSWLLLTLAHHSKGQKTKAKACWDKAEEWFAARTQASTRRGGAILPQPATIWENWLIARALRAEAVGLIGGKVDDPDSVREARVRTQLKKLDKATYDYDVALLLQPEEQHLWLARARRYRELKRDKEADADVARALKAGRAADSRVDGAERDATESALALGGRVTIRLDGQYVSIKASSALPARPFRIFCADLRNCQVTDSELDSFRNLAGLTHLHLGGSRVTDLGLAKLTGLKELALLDLSNSRITDDGLKHIRELRCLQTLLLNGTAISDAGVQHLMDMKNLRSLELHSTRMTAASMKRLQQVLPNCRIP
jgi:tetratricopeptide (TPR) repeat protein/tRNA A-37 threonylcarbamoyl transferase component Bud32/DNA-binding beta-propeller fold protein YncE